MPTEIPAAKYTQGGRDAYAAIPTVAESILMIPLRDDPEVISDANRRLFPNHGKGFGEYVWNTQDWVSGPFMVGASSVEFRSAHRNSPVGTLVIPDDAVLHLFDGQHRRYGLQWVLEREAAAAEALAHAGDADTANEKTARINAIMAQTIPVVFYVEENIEHLRQMYSDISHVRTPDAITTTRFDSRNPFNVAARALSETHALLVDRVDEDRNTLTGKSDNLLTLNQLASILTILYYGPGRRIPNVGLPEPSEVARRGQEFLDDILASSESLRRISTNADDVASARERGDLLVNVTMLKIIAAVWRDLVTVKAQSHEDVREYLSTLPAIGTNMAPDAVWVRAGVLPAETDRRVTPLARSQEIRQAVTLALEDYAAA